MSQGPDIIKFGDDHQGQLAAVLRWFSANGIPNPVNKTDPSQSVGDVVTMLRGFFPGSEPNHVGLVTCVLFGEAVDKDNLTKAMTAMDLRLRFLRQMNHIQGECAEEADGLTEPDPSEMAPFWAEIPEISPPKRRCTFGSWEAAVYAVTDAFPALIDHPGIRARITMVLWGSTDGTAPTEFGVLVAHARAFQTEADGITGLDLVVTPGTLGGERLLDEGELAALQNLDAEDAYDDVTLDQETDDLGWYLPNEDDEDDGAPESPVTDVGLVYEDDECTGQEEDLDDLPVMIDFHKRRWALPVLLVLLVVSLGVYAAWSARGFLNFANETLTSVATADQADEALTLEESEQVAEPSAPPVIGLVPGASALIDPFDPKHLDAVDLQSTSPEDAQADKPLPCTDFKLLHPPGAGPGPDACYAVGCQEGYAVPMELVSGKVWQPCESYTRLPQQKDCFIITNQDRSTRSVTFRGGKWVDKNCS